MYLYELLPLKDLVEEIQDNRMPFKLAYKLYQLNSIVEDNYNFYREAFSKILAAYGEREDDRFKKTKDGEGIVIKKGYEEECEAKIKELEMTEVNTEAIPTFTAEEFENFSLSLRQMSAIAPLIKSGL